LRSDSDDAGNECEGADDDVEDVEVDPEAVAELDPLSSDDPLGDLCMSLP
jgi:hypothetical protein